MKLNKKAQGLSITTIIVAASGLVILVVLVAIFTGRLGSFSEGISKTLSCENSCKAFDKRSQDITEEACKEVDVYQFVPGKYDDTPNFGCCCTP